MAMLTILTSAAPEIVIDISQFLCARGPEAEEASTSETVWSLLSIADCYV